MAVGDYTKVTYVNGTAPGISAPNLNNNENKTDELDTALATHLATKASDSELGHVKVDNETITTDENGVISTGRGWEKIADVTLDEDTAQVDFVSLGLENYKYFKLIGRCKGTHATSDRNLRVYFNDDTLSTNYAYRINSGVSTLAVTTNANEPFTTSLLTRNTYDYSSFELLIDNEQNKSKTMAGSCFSISESISYIEQGYYKWENNNKVSKISLVASADLIATGSTFTLLGVK